MGTGPAGERRFNSKGVVSPHGRSDPGRRIGGRPARMDGVRWTVASRDAAHGRAVTARVLAEGPAVPLRRCRATGGCRCRTAARTKQRGPEHVSNAYAMVHVVISIRPRRYPTRSSVVIRHSGSSDSLECGACNRDQWVTNEINMQHIPSQNQNNRNVSTST